MTPRRALAALAAACVAIGATSLAAQPAPPQLTAPVNDFAGVVDGESARQIESLIRTLQNATGDVIVVATVKTFQPWPDLKSYAVKMFANGGQGIGPKGKDTGLLLLVAVNDRQVWIEVGYGLEGFVTDGFSGETSRNTMAPFFRSGNYGQGILAGATRLAQHIAEGRNVNLTLEPVAAPAPTEPRGGGIPLIFWIILAIIIINAISRRRPGSGMRGGRWSSGVGTFGGGWPSSGGGWSSGGGGFGGGFGGFGGGRSGGGGGGGSW
jgi:uncharacterized protein